MLAPAAARADAPLSQGFEDGAPAWSATGMWHVQANPQTISVIPAIADRLVSLPDAGFLPAAPEGTHVAWFGEASTGTYCGADFDTIKQTPSDGCTSTHAEYGTLTSPSFSLANAGSALVVFRGWWEIEAVQADIADLMQVEYSTDGGVTWQLTGSLNPLSPSWGGRGQPYSDAGARQSGGWQTYSADLSGAVGHSDVRIRFLFDSTNTLRNGFRGLLVDGVTIVNALGATVVEPQTTQFTDAPPTLSVTDPVLEQDSDGQWAVHATLTSSHPVDHTVGVDWTVHGQSGSVAGQGHTDLAPQQVQAHISVPVSGTDAPYTTSLSNPTGAVIAPGGGSASTPGRSLPVLSLDSVGAAPGPDGTVQVSIGVKLSQPSTGPVSVDYTLTGSDGVTGGSGTIDIAPGLTTGSATVTASALHAPYTVGLSNARGAVLDPAASSASTAPLAGVSTLTSQDMGSQLVLGVRLTGSDRPTLDRTFLLTNNGGTVRYHSPGGSYVSLAPGATVILPFGTVVDATNGHAIVTVEVDAQHTLQQGEFWAGKFGVFQTGTPAVAELRLAGGDFAGCVGTSRSVRRRSAHRSGSAPIRRLWANAKGRFRTRGRFASATVRGTEWLTEDLCLATRVTVAEGIVGVFDYRRKTTTPVSAGNQITVSALQSARYRGRRGVHKPRLARVP